MANRTFTYEVKLDTGDLQAKRAQVRQLMASMFDVKLDSPVADQFNQIIAAEAQVQKSVTLSARQSAGERTAIARAESRERIEVARQGTITLSSAERRATTEFIELKRRETNEYKAQIRERERAARELANQQKRLSISGIGGKIDNVANLATGGLAAFATIQLIRNIGQEAKKGAEQIQLAEAFEAQAKRIGVSSQQIIATIQRVSGATFRESDAAALGAQLLVQKFVSQNDDIKDNIVESIGTLTQYSKEAAKFARDAEGNALSAQAIYSRFVGFFREGNKELVDQFQISNQAIAQRLGLAVEEVTQNSANRFRGTLLLLKDQIEQFGDSGQTAAEKMLSAEARISDSIDRLRQATAEPIAIVLDVAADIVDQSSVALGGASTATISRTIENRLKELTDAREELEKTGESIFKPFLAGFGGIIPSGVSKDDLDGQIERLKKFNDVLSQIGQNDFVDQSLAQIQQIAANVATFGNISDQDNVILENMARNAANYARVVSVVGEETAKTDQQVKFLFVGMSMLDSQYNQGKIGHEEYITSLGALRLQLREYSTNTDVATIATEGMTKALTALVEQATAAGQGTLANLAVASGATAENFEAEMKRIQQQLTTQNDINQPLQIARQKVGQAIFDAAIQSIPIQGGDAAKAELEKALSVIDDVFSQLSAKSLRGEGLPTQFDLEALTNELIARGTESFAGFESLNNEKERLKSQLQNAALELTESLGFDKAAALLQNQIYELDYQISQIPANLDTDALAFEMARISKAILAPFVELDGLNNAQTGISNDLKGQAIDLIKSIGLDEATAILEQQKADLARLFSELPDDLSGDELALRVSQISDQVLTPFRKMQEDIKTSSEESQSFSAAQTGIESQLKGQAVDLVEFFGLDEASAILKEQKEELARLFADIPAGLSGDDLALRISQISEQVLTPLRQMQEDIKATAEEATIIPKAQTGIEGQLRSQAEELVSFFGFQEAATILREQKTELARLFSELPSDLSGDELAFRISEISEQVLTPLRQMQEDIRTTMAESSAIPDAQMGVEGQLRSQASQLVPTAGFEEAARILREQKVELARLFAELPDGISGDELALRVAEISEQVLAPIRQMQEDIRSALAETANASDVAAPDAIVQIADAIQNLDNAAIDGLPGLASMREELFNLMLVISETGIVTNDQAATLDTLLGMTYAVADGTGYYASILNTLGFEFFNNSEQASALFERMVELDAAQQNGQISAANFAGQLQVLLQALYSVAAGAGFTKTQLDAAFAAGNKFVRQGKSVYAGDPDFPQGQKQATAFTDVQKIFASERDRSRQRLEAEKTRHTAEQGAARALTDGSQAIEKAARDAEAALQKIPGLFGLSSTTKEQMDRADAGLDNNFADDFVRRFRDQVENNKDWGIDAGDVARRLGLALNTPIDQVLAELESQWASGAFFADAGNLELINKDAVNAELALQAKIKQGQQNILDYFGATVDRVNDALAGGTGVDPFGVQATIDGKPANARIDPALKSLGADKDALVAFQTQIEKSVRPQIAFTLLEGDDVVKSLASVRSAITSEQNRTIAAGIGEDIAGLVKEGFDGRTNSFSWLVGIAAKIKAEILEELAEEI